LTAIPRDETLSTGEPLMARDSRRSVMDRIVLRQAQEVLARTVNAGGCTFDARTLLVQTWSGGYAVGLGGANLPAEAVTAEALVWLAKAVASEYETTFVGTWLHDGKVSIDAVKYFGAHAREDAIQAGIDAGQQAIFDFAAGEDITLPAWGTEAHDR
jgi:hypothetical protein